MAELSSSNLIFLFPYFPTSAISERIVIGVWSLIPTELLTLEDCEHQTAYESALQIMNVYTKGVSKNYLPNVHDKLGVFVKHRDYLIGEEMPDIENMYRALKVTIFDSNPCYYIQDCSVNSNFKNRALSSDEDSLFTTENFFLCGHTIRAYTKPNHSVVVTQEQVALTTLIFREVDILKAIQKPVETNIPQARLSWNIDIDYAMAILECLEKNDDFSRCLIEAIDWLSDAYSNTPKIRQNKRILALFNAFEILMRSHKIKATRFTDLVDDERSVVEEILQSNRKPFKSKGNNILTTKSGAWFADFAALRNDIMHGNEIKANNWEYDGEQHVFLGMTYFRHFLRAQIAENTSNKDLLQNFYYRSLMRLIKTST